MTRRLLAGLAALAVFASGCGAQGADDAADNNNPTETTAAPAVEGAGAADFGSLKDVCGPGDAKVAAADAGRGTDKLYVGVANDRASTIRAGLLKELWDAGVAFTAWCNEQGGISGLPIEAVDLDGKLLEVETAMATACKDTFAMVGGGYAQDNFLFSGKDGSDFHKCKMIAIPGFAVSTDFAEANGQVQPIPNPAYRKAGAWLADLAKLYPDKVKNFALVYGALPSIEQNKDQILAVAKQVGGYDNITQISYDAIGNQDWGLVAQQIEDSGAGAVSYVGEPGNMSKLAQALNDQGYDGLLFADAVAYDQLVIESSGEAAAEGIIARIASHPLEEADRWPATKRMIDVFEQYGPADGKLASLTTQAFSAWLLFAQSAKTCAEKGEITRTCVIQAAASVKEWDGGGLHAVGNPGDNEPPPCSMFVQVRGGKFERLFPELDSADDEGEGFSCTGGVLDVTGEFGAGNVDPSRPS